MKKLYMVKRGNVRFYICKWDCGLCSIDRITKDFGGSVIFKDTLEEIEEYAKTNEYKKLHKPKRPEMTVRARWHLAR